MSFTIYTIAEAAEILEIGKETLRNRVENAGFIHHKVGNIELITEDEIEKLREFGKPKQGRPPKRKGGVSSDVA